MNLEAEVRSVAQQQLGDTVLLWGERLEGFAVCHCGEGTEAGKNACYIKFGAVRPSPKSEENFDRLLAACETMASARGLSRLEAGVNLARHETYRQLLAYGFRTAYQGVAMHRPNEPGYSRPGVYVIDDWR